MITVDVVIAVVVVEIVKIVVEVVEVFVITEIAVKVMISRNQITKVYRTVINHPL